MTIRVTTQQHASGLDYYILVDMAKASQEGANVTHIRLLTPSLPILSDNTHSTVMSTLHQPLVSLRHSD